MSRLDDLVLFYALLDRLERKLGGIRQLAGCTGRMGWPKRGVYFFFEDGERRHESGQGPRIVRVGTHALKAGSKSTLWGRLSQHRGHAASGQGNHRGSIFRLLVGASLKACHGTDVPRSWGIGADPGQAAARLGRHKRTRGARRRVDRAGHHGHGVSSMRAGPATAVDRRSAWRECI